MYCKLFYQLFAHFWHWVLKASAIVPCTQGGRGFRGNRELQSRGCWASSIRLAAETFIAVYMWMEGIAAKGNNHPVPSRGSERCEAPGVTQGEILGGSAQSHQIRKKNIVARRRVVFSGFLFAAPFCFLPLLCLPSPPLPSHSSSSLRVVVCVRPSLLLFCFCFAIVPLFHH